MKLVPALGLVDCTIVLTIRDSWSTIVIMIVLFTIVTVLGNLN